MKVAVLGAAGGIGQALALLLKTQLPSGSELSLYDIAPVTPGDDGCRTHHPRPRRWRRLRAHPGLSGRTRAESRMSKLQRCSVQEQAI